MELAQTIEVPSRRFGRDLVRSRLGAGGMAAELFRFTLNSDQWMSPAQVQACLGEMVGIVGE